jgi:hypothetical protein
MKRKRFTEEQMIGVLLIAGHGKPKTIVSDNGTGAGWATSSPG